MYRLFVYFILSLVYYQSGCAVPDDPNWQRARIQLQKMTPKQRFDFGQWVVNTQAKKYLSGFDSGREVFHLDCSEALGEMATAEGREIIDKIKRSRPVTVGEILDCLSEHEHQTFFYCIDTFFDDDPLYGDMRCERVRAPGFQDGEIPDFWADPEPDYDPRIIEDGLRELVASIKPPPKWLWPILGVAVAVGGAVVLSSGVLPALCIQATESGQRDHWSCPSSPLYPPGKTPSPGASGGDGR